MSRLISSLFLLWICAIALIPARSLPSLEEFNDLVRRQTSDPCCKSCGLIAQSNAECPTGSDIFCGCDLWVKGAAECQACILDVGGNTTFAQFVPFIEFFWGWCQCPTQCHDVAAAIAAFSCNNGQDRTCVSETLVKEGPGCVHCIKCVDPWFSDIITVWIQEANDFLAGKPVHPDQC